MAEESSSALPELEEQRQAVVKATQTGYGTIVAGVIVVILGLVIPGQLQLFAVCAGGIVLIGGFFLFQRSLRLKREYAFYFKQKVLQEALSKIDPSLRVEPQLGLSRQEFKFSQLFTTSPDRMHSEDQVSGMAGKTRFVFSEVHAEYKTETPTKNGTQTTWHDIFRGIIFVADFNKSFKATTVVRPKGIGSRMSAWLAKHAPLFSSSEDQLVELESPDFCKEFVTWSTDQVEARYLLTPAMMERLCELNARSPDTISVSFNGNKLYLAFPMNRDYFEPPVFKTLQTEDLLTKDLEMVRFMYGIIKELDLNTRIWGKE